MIEVLVNATVVYTDGIEEQFDAVQRTRKGVAIGRIMKDDGGNDEFLRFGFIPNHSIKEIKNGTKRLINIANQEG